MLIKNNMTAQLEKCTAGAKTKRERCDDNEVDAEDAKRDACISVCVSIDDVQPVHLDSRSNTKEGNAVEEDECVTNDKHTKLSDFVCKIELPETDIEI